MTSSYRTPIQLEDEAREKLLHASRSELEAMRRERPELAPLIEQLLATESEVSLWLDAPARAATPQGHWSGGAARWALAAAAIAGVAVTGSMMLGPDPLTDSPDVVQLPSALDAPPTDLNVEAEGDFVVFPTRNPDIAVVWLLNGDD